MIVFNGGLTIEQVEKLKKGSYVIYNQVPYKRAYACKKNTFDYVPKELRSAPLHIFRRYVSEDCFSKQYIFLAKYLTATFEFCSNTDKKNYIMVCDIEEEILNNYIGVGNYIDYRIEYRVPRTIITPDTIKEFLYYEPGNKKQKAEFEEKYKELYKISKNEDSSAKKLMKEKKLIFNEYKDWK